MNDSIVELKNEIASTVVDCIGIDNLERILQELANESKCELDEEIWLQALAILRGDDDHECD